MVWYIESVLLYHKTTGMEIPTKIEIMKNTDFTLETLSTMMSSESFNAIADIICDMELEIMDINRG